MNQALRYLLWRSFLGGMRVRLGRLRQPKYWLGLLGIFLYFGILILPGLTQRRASIRMGWAGVGLAGMLLISFVLSWLIQGRKASLGFTEAETELLFCAPLTRQQLLHYRLAKVQPGLILSTLFIMLFTSFSWRYESFLLTWLGCFVLFNLLHIQGLVAIVMCGRWRGTWYQWPLRVLIAALFAAPLLPVAMGFPGVEALGSDGVVGWMKQLGAGQGTGRWLWPYLFLGKLPFATSFLDWLLRLAGCMVLWGVGYGLVLRFGVGFEERELAGAKARADALSAARRGRLGAVSEKPVRSAWVGLGATGSLWRAIAWKNFTSLTRHVPWSLIIFLMIFFMQFILILSVSSGGGNLGLKTGMLLLVLGVFFACFGSQFIKEDLRADLSNIELIKALPVSSHQLVRGEIYGAASVVILGVLAFVVVGGALLLTGEQARGLWWPMLVGAVSLFLVLDALVIVTFLVDNAIVLLFPAWIIPLERAETRHGGVEQLGRSVINIFVKMVALVLFSLLPLFFAGITWFLAVRFKVVALLPIGASIFLMVMVLQVEMGIVLLASLFEQLDLTEEGL